MTSLMEEMAPHTLSHPRHVVFTRVIGARSHQSPIRSNPSIPANILHHICLAVEDGQGDALTRKHQKNLNILAMMGVSRSWRDDIVGFNDLFGDIAFDTSNSRMIATATRILQITKAKTTELQVFIRSTSHDLVDNTKLQVTAEELLCHLGLQSSRFVYFELQSQSSHLSSYFNLPAPKLRFLRHGCNMTPVLFSSLFPNLRTLDTYVNEVFRTLPSALFNLVELRLINSHRTRRFSMESVLTSLRDAHRLEVLQLSGFARFSCVSTAVESVELANLKSAQFTDCHLPELLPRLHFPQLCEFSFHGFDLAPDENTPPFMVTNTDFFSPLQGCPLPILDQRALTHIIISVDNKDDKIEFTLRLMSGPPGPKHQFVITMAWEKWTIWEEHLKQLIRGAVERVRFASSICLYLLHHIDHTLAPYLPLLRLPQISVLCTSGWFTPVAFKLLTDSADITCPPPLPRLKCFCFRGGDLHISAEEVQLLVERCLQSRFNGRRPLAIRRWVLHGGETCLITPFRITY